PVVAVALAQILEKKGNVNDAIKLHEKVIAEHPLFGPAIRHLARLYAAHSPDAARAYELALRARNAYPNDPETAKSFEILKDRRESQLTQSDSNPKQDGSNDILRRLNQSSRDSKNCNDPPKLEELSSMSPLTGPSGQFMDCVMPGSKGNSTVTLPEINR